MYSILVIFHNLIRWIVVILGLVAVLRAFWGWIGKKSWRDIDRTLGLLFTISIDIQLLIGLILYFVYSNWALKAILENGLAYVMRQSEYRFFGIEHSLIMLIAFVFAHLGSSLPKKVENSTKKYKRVVLWFGLALVFILAGIPWSRPLLPGL